VSNKWRQALTIPREPDFTVWQDDVIYLRRWWVIPRNRWFNIYLHNFRHSDDDRAEHDHPWRNCSILLKGSYLEWLKDSWVPELRRPWRPWAPWRITFRNAETAHRVELVNEAPVWTLFITGPVVREWGFHCPRGWVHWKKFVAQVPGGNKAGAGCGDA
jgi:hypothetical protein